MPQVSAPTWSIEQRLDFIARRLMWEGRVNRADIVIRFGVSPSQATNDLRLFGELRPGMMRYDASERMYRANYGGQAPTATDALNLLKELRLAAEGFGLQSIASLGDPPELAIADAPGRPVDGEVLHAVLQAIREHRELVCRYQSFSTPAPAERRVAPHALVFDGFRWHARAQDCHSRMFKDFVLGRMSSIVLGDHARVTPSEDSEWNTRATLVICPNPDLSPAQRAVIAQDYGMKNGCLVLTPRRAVAYYVKQRLGLNRRPRPDEARDQHIVLLSEA